MNYAVFGQMQGGAWARGADETPQAHMERVLRAACMEAQAGATPRINDMLLPAFLECSAENRSLKLEFTVADWMCNSGGTLHGGLLSTAVDMTMGLLTRYLRGSAASVTAQLSVNFLRPVPLGACIEVCAEAGKLGSRVGFLSAQVVLDKRLAATATAIFM